MTKEQILDLLKILQCPISGGELIYNEQEGKLYSSAARISYKISEGILVLLKDEAITEELSKQV
ncbi:Trm112p-like protein [Candidatus Hepatincolaceae symbiont of Richtersius coronifer]